uniref:transposase family protein n=1 Tax=Scandinavium goeteborgense TaxID=1851514 RepID=UPI00358F7BC0
MNTFNHLSAIPDPRRDINVKHNLLDVLFLVFAAVLSGAQGWEDIQVFGDAQPEWLQNTMLLKIAFLEDTALPI